MAMGVFVFHIWEKLFEEMEQLLKGHHVNDMLLMWLKETGEKFIVPCKKKTIKNLDYQALELSSPLGLDWVIFYKELLNNTQIVNNLKAWAMKPHSSL